jgi:hypothetical protein
VGGAPQPTPMAGKMLNEQFAQRASSARTARMGKLQTQNDEIFQTLISSGQKPYTSPYEPENLNAPMSSQNPNVFDYRKFFDTNNPG